MTLIFWGFKAMNWANEILNATAFTELSFSQILQKVNMEANTCHWWQELKNSQPLNSTGLFPVFCLNMRLK